MQCFVLMLKVVSRCVAGLLPGGVVYERHSRALLNRLEVFVEVTEDPEVIQGLV